jgi:hypothetical protein
MAKTHLVNTCYLNSNRNIYSSVSSLLRQFDVQLGVPLFLAMKRTGKSETGDEKPIK